LALQLNSVKRAVPGAGRPQPQRKDRQMKSVLKVSENGKRVMLLTVLSFIALM
jgi:hypothetical protein